MKNKKLWGILGLIIVAALTVAAYFTPAANAEGGTTTITVNVTNPKNPAIDVTKPANNAEVVYTDGVDLDLAFEETEGITIIATPEGGEPIDIAFAPTEESGTTRYHLANGALSSFFGPVSIVVKATAEGAEDTKTLTLNLVPAAAEMDDPADNNDPIVDITVNPNVETVVIEVPDPDDPDGEPLIKAEVPADEIDEDKGITLPFEDKDLPDGDYKIVITSYDADGNVLGKPKVINYTYEQEKAPIVPDTGSFSEHLNVSKTDYLAVSLIAAGFAVIALIVLIVKRSRR